MAERWDPERRILFIELGERPRDAELLALAERVLRNPGYPSPRRELIDLRRVEGTSVSAETLSRIAAAFGAEDETPAQSRVAMVAPANLVYGLSRMYQSYRADSPLPLRVFRDYDEALAWLEGDDPAA